MTNLTISDNCIWFSHIKGNQELVKRLNGLHEGEVVILKIGDTSGAWTRMDQGKNPKQTPGLRPACDTTRAWWNEQFATRKGAVVPIEEIRP